MEKKNDESPSMLDALIGGPANILLAVIVWILVFMVFWIGLYYAQWNNRMMGLVALIMSAIVAFGDSDEVIILKKKLLLFRGEETGVKVNPGKYFTFWLWTLDKLEEITTEKIYIEVPLFDCSDRTGKTIKAEADGDWKVREDNDNYKLHDATKMNENLTKLVKKTLSRIIAKRVYRKVKPDDPEIIGEDLGEEIIDDTIFERECGKYGIEFCNLVAGGIAADLAQENLNSYFDELYAKEIAKYNGAPISHKEMEEIEKRIQVKTKTAKKIISDAPLLGKFDAL